MSSKIHSLRFGTRGSALALWQTYYIIDLLQSAHPHLGCEVEVIKTQGDHAIDTPLPLIGGKGVFTAELETALHDKRIDCAVHSLKDLPTESPIGLTIGAIAARANAGDVLISREGFMLSTLPHGAKVGTSSTRRAAQLLHHRPDVTILNIRGNIDTRIRKALDPAGDYEAIVLAHAGLERLGLQENITEVLDFDMMLPAPGQGAIAVQTRDDPALFNLLAPIHHLETALAVTAERAFLAGLGSGCSVPVAAYAHIENGQMILRGRVSSPDGVQQIDVEVACPDDIHSAVEAGNQLAQTALNRGVKAFMLKKE